jgi:hypothetical protein
MEEKNIEVKIVVKDLADKNLPLDFAVLSRSVVSKFVGLRDKASRALEESFSEDIIKEHMRAWDILIAEAIEIV